MTKLYWENESEVPEEISKGGVWAISFIVAVFFTIFCAMLHYLKLIENSDFLLIFISTFLGVGVLGSYVRRKSMYEREQAKR